MQIEKLKINEIPALLWNKPSDKLIVAVHGSHSSKIDDCIWILAEEADKQDYQVLSFDLPCHGERVYELEPGRVEPYLANLAEIMKFARKHAPNISLFACSMGAYFSLLAYAEEKLDKCLFLSPVVNMLQVIQFIMLQIGATPEQLQQEKTIPNQFETLYWDYYCYVLEHPIQNWPQPTAILRGEHDTLCSPLSVAVFAQRFGCRLLEQPGGEHWFHTPKQLDFYRQWLQKELAS